MEESMATLLMIQVLFISRDWETLDVGSHEAGVMRNTEGGDRPTAWQVVTLRGPGRGPRAIQTDQRQITRTNCGEQIEKMLERLSTDLHEDDCGGFTTYTLHRERSFNALSVEGLHVAALYSIRSPEYPTAPRSNCPSIYSGPF